MTRILVQRGNTSSSSGGGRSIQHTGPHLAPTSREEEQDKEVHNESIILDDPLLEQCESSKDKSSKADENFAESCQGSTYDTRMDDHPEKGTSCHNEFTESGVLVRELEAHQVLDRPDLGDTEASKVGSLQIVTGTSNPPPPPVPPPKPVSMDMGSGRSVSGGPGAMRLGYSRRPSAWPAMSPRTTPSGSPEPFLTCE